MEVLESLLEVGRFKGQTAVDGEAAEQVQLSVFRGHV